MKYKLLKDFPGAPAGTEVDASTDGFGFQAQFKRVSCEFADKYPDFFELMPEKLMTAWGLKEFQSCYYVKGEFVFVHPWHESSKDLRAKRDM